MNCTLSSVDSVSCNGSLGSYHSIFLLLSYLEVGFAAGTVLTMRKQLHPTLRGQDHALTRNHLRSPSKKGHFQHRCECGWKRKQRVSVGGFLCPQKALSDKGIYWEERVGPQRWSPWLLLNANHCGPAQPFAISAFT
ncbi:uncharacterized protein M6G45_001066 isoform 1-T1 [Spheniscus humboldti]